MKKIENLQNHFFKNEDFIEVYVSTPLSVCKKRDTKKLYSKSKKEKNFNMIGTRGDYEIPKKPDLIVDTSVENLSIIVGKILKKIF